MVPVRPPTLVPRLTVPAGPVDPVEEIWQTIVSRIEAQAVPYFDGQQTEPIGRLGNRTITLYRARDNRIRLYDGLGTMSAPVAVLGRDDNHISGPKAIWLLIDDTPAHKPGDARRAFDGFVEEPRQQNWRTWRKGAGGWAVK